MRVRFHTRLSIRSLFRLLSPLIPLTSRLLIRSSHALPPVLILKEGTVRTEPLHESPNLSYSTGVTVPLDCTLLGF